MTEPSIDELPSSLNLFQNKNAFITGSTRGLGRTMAEQLARLGAKVFITGREADDVQEVVRELSGSNLDAIGVAADLARPEEAHSLAEEAINALGSIDILVNNAGMSIRGHFWDVSDSEWEEQTNINIRAPFILAQHAARNMIELGTKGRIVNVGTIGARRCHRNAAVYDSAKGGVEVMTRNMAYELAPYGISVNCVVPGAIPIRPGGSFDQAANQNYLRFVPIGRFGSSKDIAAAVLYFCQPSSEFTTGQSLLVDGGHATYRPIDSQ